MRLSEIITEKWSQKYKSSINCSHPKGFSQRAHCAGKKKHNENITMEMTCPDCGMCQTHGNLNEIAKGAKDSNGFTKCWPGHHAAGTKKGKNGGQVRNCVPNESQGVAEGSVPKDPKAPKLVKDRKTGKMYDPTKEFDKTMNNPEVKDQMKRMAQKEGVAEGERTMSRAAKGYEKYGKAGMQALAKAGREGASEKKLDTIRDKYDKYDEDMAEEAKHGLYYNVNKRKEAGTSRPASSPKAPTAQAWRDAAKTTKKEGVSKELDEEFDLIEKIINNLAEYNQVDSETIWEDLESLTNDELYVFAVTTPILEDWQKVNKQDRTAGMSQKAVNTYRREHPGSKLKTAVTTKPSKLKKGSKASKRRSSYCSRSAGQKKMHHIDCSKTPDKAICAARRRWNCE